MKIYIAAPWVKRNDAQQLAASLSKEGFDVTSRWHVPAYVESSSRPVVALRDLEDIDRADALVLVTSLLDENIHGKGMYIEFGYALGKGKKVFRIGPSMSVFDVLASTELI